MKTSEQLTKDEVYTRNQLKEMFRITDATINTGIFQPDGHESVWLFVTESKTPDRVQYENKLLGNLLKWDSQTKGRKDHLIIHHQELNLELLLFHRMKKYEHDGAGFRYEGPFEYLSHEGHNPAHFELTRLSSTEERQNYWAILCNPSLYGIEKALATLPEVTWELPTHAVSLDPTPGDQIVFWKTKGTDGHRGVLTIGEVLTSPTETPEDPESARYWIKRPANDKKQRIRIRFHSPPMAPLWINQDKTGLLESLSVSKAQGNKLYKVTPLQWKQLLNRLGGLGANDREIQKAIARTGTETLETLNKKNPTQGFAVSAAYRKAVETHAMEVATKHFTSRGYEVQDTSLTKPYDLVATKDDAILYIEVKGTSTSGEKILLTKNEVRHAQRYSKQMVLFILKNVQVTKQGGSYATTGGNPHILSPWTIEDNDLTCLSFSYQVPPGDVD